MAAKKRKAAKKATARRSAKRPAKKGRKAAARKPAKKGRKAAGRKTAARKPAKKARKAAKKKSTKKRGVAGGLAIKVTPNERLAAVVGSGPLTRAEITKRIWDYIKKNNLQDRVNRRNINADDKLRPIFGGKGQVSMFEMTKLVNQNVR